MKYLALRVDIPKELCEDTLLVNQFIDKILDRYHKVLQPFGDLVQATFGLETALKSKKLHFHYHVGVHPLDTSKKWLAGMSSYISRNWEPNEDVPPLPPNGYSISPPKKKHNHDNDIGRWFGYCFKDYSEQLDLSQERIKGFSEDDIKFMFLRATAERKVALATFNKYENKLNNDKISRDTMWQWLDKELPHLSRPKNMRINGGEVTHYNPIEIVATKIVEFDCKYNDYKIKMDLKRRAISYCAKRGVMSYEAIANWIMR